MEPLIYTPIKNKEQYDEYCQILHDLDFMDNPTENIEDHIDMLTLLIEHFDEQTSIFRSIDVTPVDRIRSLMLDHQLSQINLANELGVSRALISSVLSGKREVSKDLAGKLAVRFKMRMEVFLQMPTVTPSPMVRDSIVA